MRVLIQQNSFPGDLFLGYSVFASNDLRVWQLMQGSDRKEGKVTDIFLTRSHAKAKCFIFVFAAQLEEGSVIGEIDLQYYYKLGGKIR